MLYFPFARPSTSSAPSRSWMPALCTTTASNVPSVSVRMCRLRPLTFLPASYRGPPFFRRPYRLAVEHRGGRLGGSSLSDSPLLPQAIIHPFEAVVGAPGTKGRVDELPLREVLRQHSPATRAPRHVADRVHHFSKVRLSLPTSRPHARQHRLDCQPLLIGQIARVAFGLLLDLGQPLAMCFCPHSPASATIAQEVQAVSKRALSASAHPATVCALVECAIYLPGLQEVA